MNPRGSLATRARRVLDLLDKGIAIEDMASHLADAHTLALQRQCALLRRTDRAGLGLALAPVTADLDAELPGLLARGDLTQPAADRDLYLIPRGVRETHLRRWDLSPGPDGPAGADAAAFRAQHLALAEHFSALGPAWEHEHLHHRLAADPLAGLDLMDALLAVGLPQPAAEGDGALPAMLEGAIDGLAVARALDLLDLVHEQLPFLPEGLKPRYNRARGRVESWSWWSDDWFRTRRYVQRPRVQPALVTPGTRILELTAPGGSGKTMLLRWFITHHCLPRGRPIAHLDFDHFIDRPRQPWQLLILCAEQLDRQFAQAPFYSLILRGRDLEQATAAAAAPFVAALPESFGGILNSQGQEPVTLVVDTFEEAMLTDPATAVGFVALLLRCALICPRLRLVLCGRYPLTHLDLEGELERADAEAHRLYAEQVQRLRLPLFDPDEAAEYLARRDVVLPEAALARVLEVAAGIVADAPDPQAQSSEPESPTAAEISPFHLALIADLLHDRLERGEALDGLLAELHQVPVIYLIERVILRIDDVGVRWLLRYGVVPRRLTRDFFEQVILPHIKRVHRQGRPPDGGDPVERALPVGLAERSLFFGDSAIFQDGESAAWDKLCQFAGTDSWVEADDDALLFHVCVRDPMLALLEQDPALANIHEDAAAWFAKAAGSAADAGVRAALEADAVYHGRRARPQHQGLAMAQALARLHERLAAEDFPSAYAIASEIGQEYAEDLGEKRLLTGVAQFLLALDLADLADSPAGRDGWLATAGRALRQLGQHLPERAAQWLDFLDALRQVREPPFDLVPIKAAFELLLGGLPKLPSAAGIGWSLAALRDWGQRLLTFSGLEPLLGPRLARALAIARERLGDPQCVAEYARLLEDRPPPGADGAPAPLTAFLIEALSRSLGCFGDQGGAFATLTRALSGAGPLRASATRGLVDLLDRLGYYEGAATFAADAAAPAPAAALARIRAESRDSPKASLAALAALTEQSGQVRPDAAEAAGQALTAYRCSALIGDLPGALRQLGDAEALFREVQSAEGAVRCALLEARFWLWHHGNPGRAGQALERYGRALAWSGGDGAASLRFGLVDLSMRLGPAWRGAVGAGDLDIDQAIGGLDALSCTGERIGAAVTLIALLPATRSAESANRIAETLIAALERRPDAISRACYPWTLRERRSAIPLGPALADRLAALLDLAEPPPPLLELPPGDSDLAWARLTHAHLLRLMGHQDQARRLVELAAVRFEAIGSLTGLREVWHLRAMNGWDRPAPGLLGRFVEDSQPLRDMVAIEQAEHALRTGALGRARDWLAGVNLAQLSEWPSHFHPRALLVAARLVGGDREARLGLLRRAAAAFEGLGNPRGLRRCQVAMARIERSDTSMAGRGSARDGAREPMGPAEAWTYIPGWTLSLGPRGDRLTLGQLGVDELGQRLSEALGAACTTGPAEVAALTETLKGGREVAPPALVRGLASAPGRFAADIAGELLRRIAGWPIGSASKHDLVIDAERLSAAALPWELVRLDRARWQSWRLDLLYRCLPGAQAGARYAVRWLQAGLRATVAPDLAVDGLIGPRTEAGLEALLAKTGGQGRARTRLRRALVEALADRPRPLAVILQGTGESQRRSHRGLAFGGARLEDVYEQAGFRCELVDGLDLDGWLARYGDELPATVVHIYATWVEERSSGYVGPDFGERATRRGPLRKGGPVSGRRGAGEIPLLILDGPAEPDPAEQVRQLLLRNAAGTLFSRRADCPNILGLGLDAYPDLDALGRLLGGFRSGGSLREAYAGLAEVGSAPSWSWLADALPRETGRLAPALWTADPDLSVLRLDGR